MKKTVQTLLLFICFSCFATGQQSAAVATLNLKSPSANLMPDKWIGNWINCETNHWDYGFFEKFAIYRNDFWDYQTIETDKKGEIALTLVKGRETVQLKLKQGKNNQITIGTAKGKAFGIVKWIKHIRLIRKKTRLRLPNLLSGMIRPLLLVTTEIWIRYLLSLRRDFQILRLGLVCRIL